MNYKNITLEHEDTLLHTIIIVFPKAEQMSTPQNRKKQYNITCSNKAFLDAEKSMHYNSI